jgi:hypothetical protein
VTWPYPSREADIAVTDATRHDQLPNPDSSSPRRSLTDRGPVLVQQFHLQTSFDAGSAGSHSLSRALSRSTSGPNDFSSVSWPGLPPLALA